MIYDFAVIGGDMRQVYLANYLKNQRYQVITYATKKEGSECKEGKSFENVTIQRRKTSNILDSPTIRTD